MRDLWVFCRFMGAPGLFGDWYWPRGIRPYPPRYWWTRL
jgi:hypothetical protein